MTYTAAIFDVIAQMNIMHYGIVIVIIVACFALARIISGEKEMFGWTIFTLLLTSTLIIRTLSDRFAGEAVILGSVVTLLALYLMWDLLKGVLRRAREMTYKKKGE